MSKENSYSDNDALLFLITGFSAAAQSWSNRKENKNVQGIIFPDFNTLLGHSHRYFLFSLGRNRFYLHITFQDAIELSVFYLGRN